MLKRSIFAGAALALLTVPGFAADLPMKGPAYVPPPVYDWTGLYVGGNVGWGWAQLGSTELAPGTAAFPTGTVFSGTNLSGFLGGVQAGFNYQTPYNLVLGLEGEYSWTDLTGTETTISTAPRFVGFSSTVSAKTTDFALLTGRLGYAANNWLLYAKGGVAFGQGSSSGVGRLANGTFFETTATSSERTGWVVGAGIEWGFAPNWSAKLEYNHIDFGSTPLAVVGTVSGTSFVGSSERIDVVKAGINWRWGGMPVY